MADKTLGEVLHEAREAGNDGRDRPMFLAPWAERNPRLKELDEAMAAAVEAAVRERLRTHEHEWTRCPECKQPGQPCPCSGTACCEMERREIAAANDAAREERERIAADPETPLSDALHTLGEVQRMAESMVMSRNPMERECGRRVLAVIGPQGDEEPALPVAAELEPPETDVPLPFPESP